MASAARPLNQNPIHFEIGEIETFSRRHGQAAPHEVQLRPLSCHAAKKYERFQLVDFCPPSQTLYHMTVKQNLRFS